MNASKRWPLITSTRRAKTSVATEYSHDVPGWKTSGRSAKTSIRQRAGGIDDFSRVVGVENQRARAKKTVAQPRTVTHQMANGDRPNRRLGLVQRRRVGTQHTAVRKLRNKLLNRIVKLEVAFFE